MDNMLVWILVFAGAAIALLATFLAASERELKKSRVRIDSLQHTLNQAPRAAESGASEKGERSQLELRNRELEEELGRLSLSLREAEDRLGELQRGEERSREAETHLVALEQNNLRLKERVLELEESLRQAEQNAATRHRGKSDREAELEQTIEQLGEELERVRRRARELETMTEQLEASNSRVDELRARNQALESRVAELEVRHLEDRERLSELDGARTRVIEVENAYRQALQDARYLEQEIARWQDRARQTDDAAARLTAMRARWESIRADLSAATEHWGRLEAACSELSEILAQTAAPEEVPAESPLPADTASKNPDMIQSERPANGDGAPRNGRRWLLGTIAAILLLGGGAALISRKDGSTSDGSSSTISAVIPTPVPEFVSGELQPTRESDRAPARPQSDRDLSGARIERPRLAGPRAPTPATSKQRASSPARPRSEPIRETRYEIVRRTSVYSRPDEGAPPIANIDPGMQVHVVSSRDGWLEIRSRHGRPPGYIRQDTAVRAGSR